MSVAPKPKYDWKAIAAEYITGRAKSLAELAREHGCSLKQVERRCKKDGWVQARNEGDATVLRHAIGEVLSKDAGLVARLLRLQHSLGASLLAQVLSNLKHERNPEGTIAPRTFIDAVMGANAGNTLVTSFLKNVSSIEPEQKGEQSSGVGVMNVGGTVNITVQQLLAQIGKAKRADRTP